jgi:phosphonate transport system permease protein
VANKRENLKEPRVGHRALKISLWLAASGLVYWSLQGSEFSGQLLWRGIPEIFRFFGRLLPPNWSVWEVLVKASVETLQTTIAGTFLGALLAYPLGVLAASTWTPTWVHLPIKALLALIRSIPLLLLALLFVSAVGLGPFPGVLAIAVHSAGVLGRFVAEEIENTDPKPLLALQGTGASPIQIIQHGLIPQVLPQMVAHLAIRFEMNLRDSTILGLVGAGGLGFYVFLYVKQFQWQKTGVLCLAIIFLVFVGELISWQIRKRLI